MKNEVITVGLRCRTASGDYLCGDGELESAVNVDIAKPDGTLCGLYGESEGVGDGGCGDGGCDDGETCVTEGLLFVHRGGDCDTPNYIFRSSGGGLEWAASADELSRSEIELSEALSFPAAFSSMGNVVVICAANGVQYLLWQKEERRYRHLGPLPEPPAVEFALCRTTLEGWHIHPDMLPYEIVEKGEPDEDGWGLKAMEVLSRFEDKVKSRNLFIEPFFALTALRLSDGSHILPSPPVLMIPNSGAFPVAGSSDFTVPTMKMSVGAAVCALQTRISADGSLRRWSGVVTHIDIFVSRTLPLYERGKGMTAFHRTELLNYSHSIAPDGIAGEHRVLAETIGQGWIPTATGDAFMAGEAEGIKEFRKISELPVDSLPESGVFHDVVFNCGDLDCFSTLESYLPDYGQLSDILADGCSVISGRLTLWGLTVGRPEPPSPGRVMAYVSGAALRPRWVFTPDPDARSYSFDVGGEMRQVALRRHPFLRGAFYWGGLTGEPEYSGVGGDSVDHEWRGGETGRLRAGVWRGEKGNPFLLPDKLLMRLDVERVIALCRAFRASGLVATTSPTVYAFTSDGVFLLKESDDGALKDAGLISSHILRDSRSFVVKGRTVEFLSESGERLVIEGSVVKSLTASESGVSSSSAARSGSVSLRGRGEEAVFATRPVKLGDGERCKQMGSAMLRGCFSTQKGELSLWGSRDLRGWQKIATGTPEGVFGLWPSRFRFFRVECRMPLASGETVEALVFRLRRHSVD